MSKLQIVGGTDIETEDTETIPLLTNPQGPSDYWLENLGIGTIFLVKRKNSREFSLGEFCLQSKTNKAVHLVTKDQGSLFVDPKEFSRQFDLFDVLMTSDEFKKLQEQEETKDEEHINTD